MGRHRFKRDHALASDRLQRSSEESFHSMLDLPVGVAKVSLAGRYLHVNEKLCQMLGYSPAELAERTLQDVTHPEDRQVSAAKLESSFMDAPEEHSLENRYIRKDGTIFWGLVRWKVVRDSRGRPLHAVTTVQDVTRRKRAEDTLRKREDQLCGIIDNSSAFIFIKNLDGRYLKANRWYERMRGLPEAEILGKTDYDLYPKEIADVLRNNDREVIAANRPIHFEEHVPFADGLHHFVAVKFPLNGGDGKPDAVCGIATDITERKRAEIALKESREKLQLALEAADVGTWRVNLQSGLRTHDAALNRILGLPEDHLSMPMAEWFDRVHPNDARRVQESWDRAMKSGHYDEEHRMVRPDGKIAWVRDRGRFFDSPDGKPLYATGALADITARKQADRALREKAKLLDLTQDSVMVCDLNDVITFWNRGANEMYGWTPEEAVGRVSHELLQTTFPKPLNEIKAKLLQSGRWEGELVRAHRDGAHLTVASRWTLQTDEDGDVIGILETNNDISKRKGAEEALFRNKQFNQAILDSLGANIAVLNKAGEIIAVNNAWKHYALQNGGSELADAVGINYLEVCRRSREKDADAAKALRGTEDVLNGARPEFQLEYPCHSPDEKRWFLMSVTPLLDKRGGVVVTHTNITERKQIEQALQESEERLQLAMEGGDIGTFDWNIQTNAVIWTEPKKATFGHPSTASHGRYDDWAGQVHPEDLPACEAGIQKALQDKQRHWQAEYRLTAEEISGPRWMHSQGHIFYDNRGEPLRMIGINMDVTERKQAEEALRQSEAGLRQLADAMPQIVFTCGPNGKADYANGRWYEYTGVSLEESVGFAWQNTVHPDDRERTLRAWMDAVKTGRLYEIEYRFRRHDGQYRWHLSRAIPIRNADKQIVKWIGTSTDIHDRKQAEAEREQLLAREKAARTEAEDAAEWIRRLQAVTDSALGRLSLDELLHETLPRICELLDTDAASILLPSEDGRSLVVRAAVGFEDAALGTRIPIGEGLAGKIAATRSPLIVEDVSTSDVINPILRSHARCVIGAPLVVEGRLIGVVHADTIAKRRFTENDVRLLRLAADRIALAIEQTRLYEIERQERRQAEEANRMKDEFLALVSHELRSPLTAILGYARLLGYGPLDAQMVKKAVEVIERSGRAQTQLIEDLLDTARIISGKLRIDIGPVDLVTVIASAVQTISPAADAKGIRIQTDLNANVGQITGDSARLQQVIWNLLSNAVKFTPSGGRVDVRLERMDPHICITVSDTGKGIPPDFLPYMFDRFRQADASSTRRYGGLGLGLALVKYLVELHGGTVEAFSGGEGKGATFKVLLPVRAVLEPLESEDALALAEPEKATLAGIRVLVVDDEDDARELVKAVIAKYGADVVAAKSAAEAFALITTPPDQLPDVLVTDLGLPDEDGYSLLRRLREWERERGIFIPAVALTAYGRFEDRMRALKAGFQMHVSKPVEPDELAVVIASVAGRAEKGVKRPDL
jgi:PAS domain S-box-containing protein